MKNVMKNPRPSVAQLQEELIRIDTRQAARLRMQSRICLLAALAASLSLAVALWCPIVQVHGNSMSPTLRDGDVLLCLKTKELGYGDITFFYHNNKILVKRLIGAEGDTIDLHEDGKVIRNNNLLAEPYIACTTVGTTDIPLPCRVPADSLFLMGDHRETSLDSRSITIGCIPKERVLGKAVLRLWPLARFGIIPGKKA